MAAPLHDPRYLLGVAMVLGGGVCLSTGGIILRNLEAAHGWQVLFYRAGVFVFTLLCVIIVRNPGEITRPFVRIGLSGVLAAMFFGFGSVCYIFSLTFTTVANAAFIIGASPVFTAIVAWMLLGERLSLISVLTMLAALGGISLMFADGFVTGRLLGHITALGVVAGFTGMLVCYRWAKSVDMLPATCLGGLFACVVSGFMADSLIISNHDLVLILLMGTVQFSGGFILITLGTRYVPAAEVALLSLSEAVLAPIWVWIGVNEVPSVLTLMGSAVVLAAVVTLGVSGLRQSRQVAQE